MIKTLLKLLGGNDTALKLNEFYKARFKLTFYYLLIISFILIIFSFVLYIRFSEVIEKKINSLEIIYVEKVRDIALQNYNDSNIKSIELDNWTKYDVLYEDWNELSVDISSWEIENDRWLLYDLLNDFEDQLIILNIFIVIISILFSYYLSWKTLKPIEEKMNEKDKFIENASHELRNPLSVIKTYSELSLKNKKLDRDSIEWFQVILDESNRLINISNDLLLLSRWKDIYETKENINIKSLLEETIKILETFLVSKNISLETSLKDFYFLWNKELIKKVFYNLIHNAIKFSSDWSKISIILKSDWYFSIKDYWIWIDKDKLAYIFNRFYKADDSRHISEENWSWLGLSIVKDILDNYAIKINVESQKWNWTIVSFKFT